MDSLEVWERTKMKIKKSADRQIVVISNVDMKDEYRIITVKLGGDNKASCLVSERDYELSQEVFSVGDIVLVDLYNNKKGFLSISEICHLSVPDFLDNGNVMTQEELDRQTKVELMVD